jgi:hypothetical protein
MNLGVVGALLRHFDDVRMPMFAVALDAMNVPE